MRSFLTSNSLNLKTIILPLPCRNMQNKFKTSKHSNLGKVFRKQIILRLVKSQSGPSLKLVNINYDIESLDSKHLLEAHSL